MADGQPDALRGVIEFYQTRTSPQPTLKTRTRGVGVAALARHLFPLASALMYLTRTNWHLSRFGAVTIGDRRARQLPVPLGNLHGNLSVEPVRQRVR